MKLSTQTQTFVSHFGEMSSRWGFNRTVGQMLALLVIHPQPLHADHMADALHISRGNVSMGLKELQSWRLIQLKRFPGDRKDYFTAAGTILEMAKTVFEERRKREIDPTLSVLRTALLDNAETEQDKFAHQQMSELLDLLEHLTEWGQQLNDLSPAQLQGLMTLGLGVGKVLEFKEKMLGKPSAT